MLDRQLLRSQPEFVKAQAAKKGLQPPVDEFLAVDSEWRSVKSEADELKAEQNRASKSIGALMSQGKAEEVEAIKTSIAQLKERANELNAREKELDEQLKHLELEMPNLPHESVPEGSSEADNVEVRTFGTRPQFDQTPKPHWELLEQHQLADLPRGTKVAGSGFVAYTGIGAKLQRALINYMLDIQTRVHGYHEVYPPYLVNEASLIGTGQLPKFGEELYRTQDDLYLIPTAEVPVTNLYRDEILEATQLPIRMAAFTGCFRREAGAAGKDTRGIQRVHQFDKIELVVICRPEESYELHEAMLGHAQSVLESLELHYRTVLLCGKEMSFGNAKCYDIEVWAPGVDRYLEVSSVSNFEAFQARRANIRFRPAPGEKPEYTHILNGSGLALPRLYAALLEQHQQSDGSIRVPEKLVPYLGLTKIG